jgi:N-acetylmuramoyl-L-alanine amidase
MTFIFNTTPIQATPDYKLIYVIQQGDTLSEIAEGYGVEVDSILLANNIKSTKMIRVGEELIIPEIEKSSHLAEAENNKWNYNFFTNKNVSAQTQLSLEDTTTYSVRINPKKVLPEVNIPPGKVIKYHVGVGDTLFDLARKFNTSSGIIMALNNMDKSIIRVGEKIKLPIDKLSPEQVIAKTIKPRDVELLARAIFGESRGEPFIGQVAVGSVVINRVLSDYFPDTFYDVIYQSGQFSAVSDGQINLSPNQTAFRAAREAIGGKDPTMGALYYYNPKIAANKWWFSTRKLLVTIGDHVFAK